MDQLRSGQLDDAERLLEMMDDVVDLLASYAADGTVMDDDVFGAVPYVDAGRL